MNSGAHHPTPRQLALIHVAKARLGLEEEEYRDLLESVTGRRSAADLEPGAAAALLHRFAELGFRPRAGPAPSRPGMASPSQIGYIQALWRDYTDGVNPGGLHTWLRRRFGISTTRRLTREMAQQTLVALKAMLGRKRGRRRAPAPKPSRPTN